MAIKTAKIVRILSVPPVMAAVFLFLLYRLRPDIIKTREQLLVSLYCLSVFPLLAYPVSWILRMPREKQRTLAMIFSAASYISVWVYSFLTPCGRDYRFICGTYVFSVLLLLISNKLPHLRSSGHACSVTGPIALLCFFLGLQLVPLCILLYTVLFWASLRSRRHTALEFLRGSACCLCAGVLSYFTIVIV